MIKRLKYGFALLIVCWFLGHQVSAQNLGDTVKHQNPDSVLLDSVMFDSLLDDSLLIDSVLNDSLAIYDSLPLEKRKWSFISGGNDSTYFSFYGHTLDIHDTLLVRYWNYNKSVHELELYHFDSTLNDLQNFHPAYQKSFNNLYLGNVGLAVKSNLYFEPLPKTDFIFINAFNAYNFQANNTEYFNVLKPFTKFEANVGPNDEQDIDVVHTQNINPYVNAFIRFKNFTSNGDYIYQTTRNNSGVIGGSYTQGPLATHLNITFSNVNAEENGGLTDPLEISDPDKSANQMSMRLNNASNYIKDRQLFFDQKIGFLKTNVSDSAEIGDYWFSFQYNFHQHRSVKLYQDEPYEYVNIYTEDTLSFYENTYNGSSTFDSLYFLSRKHLFRINLEEIPYSYPFVGAYVGVGFDRNTYAWFNVDTLFNNSQSNAINNTYLEGGIYRLRGKKFKFAGNYIFYIDGYKQTDFSLDGFISQKFGSDSNYFELKGEGGVFLESADYLFTNFYSNHYRWQNTFNATKRTELKFHFLYPKFNLITGVRFSTLTDYVYLNNAALPDQQTGTFAILNAYVKNRFEVYRFGLKTQLSYQETGNASVLPLPKFSGYAALYWFPTANFKSTGGTMKFDIGADVYYWTKFYGLAYDPALAQFHTQNYQTYGNYPFVGAFVNFEIKRLRFYLRAEHLNFDEKNPNYFLAPSYPSNRLVIRYGISWTFYD